MSIAEPKIRGIGEGRDMETVELFISGSLTLGAVGPGAAVSTAFVAPYNCNINKITAFAATGPVTTPAMIDLVKRAANGGTVTSLLNSRLLTDAVVATSTTSATGVNVGLITSTQANWQLADQSFSLLQYNSASTFLQANFLQTMIPYGSQIDFGGGVTPVPVLTQNVPLLQIPFICPSTGTVAAGSPVGVVVTNRIVLPPVASGASTNVVNFPVVTVPTNVPNTPVNPTQTVTTNFAPGVVSPQTAAYAPTYSGGPTAFANPGPQESIPQLMAGDLVYPWVVNIGGTAAANVTLSIEIERV